MSAHEKPTESDSCTELQRVKSGPVGESFFSTAHLVSDLRRRSVHGAIATVSAQGLRLLLQIGSTAILARMLTPGDFGLVAMATPVVAFASVLADAGLSMATVQRAEIHRGQVSNLFWFNCLLGLVLCLGTVLIAPTVAWFYAEASLAGLTAVLSTTLFLTGLNVQHNALLTRQMRFGTVSLVMIVAQIVSIGAGIAGAYWGLAYWALAVMQITNAACVTVMTWALVRWLPSLPDRKVGTGGMLAFGGNLAAFGFINFFIRNLDNVLIGSVWGKGALGLYSRAYSLLLMPVSQINGPVTKVAMPALSRLQGEPERFRQYYRKGILMLTALGMPMVAFCAVSAHDMVLFVLGDQWVAAAPIFQALAPAAFCGTFNVALGWVLVPLGQVKRQLHAVLFSAAINIAAFFIGLPWGAVGVALCFSVGVVITQVPMLIYAYSRTPVRLGDFWWAIWMPSVSSLGAGMVLHVMQGRLEGVALVFRLGCNGLAYGLLYGVAMVLVARFARRELPFRLGGIRSMLRG